MAQAVALLLLLVTASAARAAVECRTPDPSPAEIAAVEVVLAEHMPPSTTPVTIPVYFHVVHQGPVGQIDPAIIDDQIAVLNAAYAGLPGGAATRFQFSLADTTYTDNASWYSGCHLPPVESQMKSALRQGGADALNLYTCGMTGSGLLGWATFPHWYDGNPMDDGVVVLDQSLPGGTAAPYNQGDIATHEVGHWLGLYHTYQGGCDGGDQVADTPAEAEPSYDCSGPPSDSCAGPGFDPIRNYMDFSADGCLFEFTPGQSTRADAAWDAWRGNLVAPPVPVGDVLPIAMLLAWSGARALRGRSRR